MGDVGIVIVVVTEDEVVFGIGGIDVEVVVVVLAFALVGTGGLRVVVVVVWEVGDVLVTVVVVAASGVVVLDLGGDVAGNSARPFVLSKFFCPCGSNLDCGTVGEVFSEAVRKGFEFLFPPAPPLGADVFAAAVAAAMAAALAPPTAAPVPIDPIGALSATGGRTGALAATGGST